MDVVKISVLQMNSSAVPQENLDFIVSHLVQIKNAGATHLFLPENANFIQPDRQYSLRYAENNPDSIFIPELQKKAKEFGLHIHIGSVKYRISENKVTNRSLSISDRGEIIGHYDKVHLFDVVISETEAYRESDVCDAGKEIQTCTMDDFKLGYSICYDIRFPFLFQRLRDENVDVIAIPAAFTVPTGKAHWESLLRARAIETQSYVVAAAQAGIHYHGRQTYGHSMIINPWGDVLAEANGESTDILYAEIDKKFLEEIRRKMPIATHRIKFF